MHKRNTNNVRLDIWQTLKDWTITPIKANSYAFRLSYPIIEPKEVPLYEDDNIVLQAYKTDPKTTLGYVITTKYNNFIIVQKDWHISFIHPEVQAHTKPKVVYKDINVFLRKFNEVNLSYWLNLRKKNV